MMEEKVLLVDDEEEFIKALSERLELRNIRVVTAADGARAVELSAKENFDAIVLDLMMPGIDGIETLKRILAADKDAQVVLLTGHATVAKGVEAIKLGASNFLEKPADINQLVDLIKEAKIKRMIIKEKQTEAQAREILKHKGW